MNDYDPTTTAIDELEAAYDTYYNGCLAEGIQPLPLVSFADEVDAEDMACRLSMQLMPF